MYIICTIPTTYKPSNRKNKCLHVHLVLSKDGGGETEIRGGGRGDNISIANPQVLHELTNGYRQCMHTNIHTQQTGREN